MQSNKLLNALSVIVFCIFVNDVYAKLSDLRKCADENCRDIISAGRTTQRYFSREKGVLSFHIDEPVQIYSKEAGSNLELWGVKIKERSGFVPKKFIREEKEYTKFDELKHYISTNIPVGKVIKSLPSSSKESKNNIFDEPPMEEIILKSDVFEYNTLNKLGEEQVSEFNTKDKNVHTVPEHNVLTDSLPEPSDLNKNKQHYDTDNSDSSNDKVHTADITHDFVVNEHYNAKHDPEIITQPVDTIKEIDNEDEGNGNVGEENGSEASIESSVISSTSPSQTIDLSSMKVIISDSPTDFIASTVDKSIDTIHSEIISSNGHDEQLQQSSITETEKDLKMSITETITEILQSIVEPQDYLTQTVEINKENIPSVIENKEMKHTAERIKEFLSSSTYSQEALPGLNTITQSKEELKFSQIDSKEKLTPSVVKSSDLISSITKLKDGLISSITKLREGVISSNIEHTEQSQFASKIHTQEYSTDNAEQLSPAVPTPVPTTVVAGTTFLLNDPEPYDSNDYEQKDSFDSISTIPLQTSKIDEIHSVSYATPTFSQNKIIDNNEVHDFKIDSSIPPLLDRLNHQSESVMKSEITVPNTHIDNNSMDEEFTSPKPETVIDGHINEKTILSSENDVEKNQGIDSIPAEGQVKFSEEIHDKDELPANIGEKETLTAEEEVVISEEPGFLSSLFSMAMSSDNDEAKSDSNGDINISENDKIIINEGATKSGHNYITSENIQESDTLKASEHQQNLKSDGQDTKILEINLDESQTILDSSEKMNSTEESNRITANLELQIETSSLQSQASMPEQLSSNKKEIDLEIAKLKFIDTSDSLPDQLKNTIDPDSAGKTEEGMGDTIDEMSIADKILEISVPLWNGLMIHISQISEGMGLAVEGELANPKMSAGSVMFLTIVSGTILIIYIIHHILIKFSREAPLLDTMNKLNRQQRIIVEENDALKEKLTTACSQVLISDDQTSLQNDKILQLEANLTSSKDRVQQLIIDLEESTAKIHQLEIDFEISVANAEELHTMNSDLLSAQKETTNFEESVNNLQSMLSAQRDIVENLTSDLTHKTRLVEELRNDCKSSNTKSIKLDNQIEQMMKSLEEVNIKKQECLTLLETEEGKVISLTEMNNSLRKEADDIRLEWEHERLNGTSAKSQIKEINAQLRFKLAECQVAKECFKKLQLHANDCGNGVKGTLEELLQILEVKSKLIVAESDCDNLKEQLCNLEKSSNGYREQERIIASELSQIKISLIEVSSDRDQIKSKLEVLSQYYEEKEMKLKKELESQEDLRLDAEGSAVALRKFKQSYEHENSSLREKVESFKNELEEQDKSFKMQLTNVEKRAHENWIACRSAERRQEELRQENMQLRQRLSMLHSHDKNLMKRGDLNGSLPSPLPPDTDPDGLIDPLMMRPPLPMHSLFRPPTPHGMPPPLPWGLPPIIPPPGPHPDRRMPPAGRIASPPAFDRRSYSPASDHSHYSDHHHHRGYSPGPPRYSPDRSRRHTRRRDQFSPNSIDRHSPDRWITRSPPGGFGNRHRSPVGSYNNRPASPMGEYSNMHRSPPRGYYDEDDNDESRRMAPRHLGKKTSTPLGPNDR